MNYIIVCEGKTYLADAPWGTRAISDIAKEHDFKAFYLMDKTGHPVRSRVVECGGHVSQVIDEVPEWMEMHNYKMKDP